MVATTVAGAVITEAITAEAGATDITTTTIHPIIAISTDALQRAVHAQAVAMQVPTRQARVQLFHLRDATLRDAALL
jgi:hypothetical protein